MTDLRAMHAAAEEYIERGWPIVSIPPVNGRPAKGPTKEGWPDHLLEAGCAASVLREGWNIGLLLCSGFADIDLDCHTAREAAAQFLPNTGLVYGHASSPASHRLYRVSTPLPYKKFALPDDADRGALLELRAMLPAVNGAKPKAFQSVLPPSTHPTGERYEWEKYGEAALVAEGALWRAVHLVAITATFAKLHPPFDDENKTARDEFRLAISGVVARRLPEQDALNVFTTALRIAGDRKDRRSIFQTTLQKLRGNSAYVKGVPALVAIIGQKAANSVLAWIDAIAEKETANKTAHVAEVREPGDEPETIVGPDGVQLPDMPESVFAGRLGELCQTRLKDFPVSFSWPAVLAAASALVRTDASALRANIYAALVGPVHCGKSAAIERANFLLDAKPPFLEHLKAGSAEGLLAKIGNRQGQGVLLNPDELSHLLEKTQITNASFAYILNSLFYVDADQLTIARGKAVNFNARLSLVGGIVDEKFDDAFGSATTSGLYDRFLFGQCPTGFAYLWRPIEGPPAFTDLFEAPTISRDVWEARDEVAKAEGLNPRLLEISLRTAFICAAVDGRRELGPINLEPAWELARYQTRVRMLLQPNCGKNFEAKIALKILAYLNRRAPDGQWLPLRQVVRDTRAYDYGPSIAERAINAMKFGGAIEEDLQLIGKGQKRRVIRLAGEYQ